MGHPTRWHVKVRSQSSGSDRSPRGYLRQAQITVDAMCCASGSLVVMPIVDVTYGPQVAEQRLLRLAQTLPHAISLAVECPEEHYDQVLKPGDVEICFRPRGTL
jgi:hypothetical protein